MEIWKDIEGYEGLYQVSNEGRVKSLERVVIMKNGTSKTWNGTILKGGKTKKGYMYVNLSKNNVKDPRYVHILVATAFIPNPHNYTVVHHINGNHQDNRVENLCWMPKVEHDAVHAKERGEKLSMRVDQIDRITGEVLYKWESLSEVERQLGYSIGNICACCKNKYLREGNNIYKGFKWSYERTQDN